MVSRQPVTRRGRQEGRLTWRYPGAEGLELLHDPFSQADLLLSLGSGQIHGCLGRGAGWSTPNRLLDLTKGVPPEQASATVAELHIQRSGPIMLRLSCTISDQAVIPRLLLVTMLKGS